MSRYNPHRDTAPVLAGAAAWTKRCLLADGSLFVESESLWTLDHLDELDRLFIQNAPESEGSFFDKLKDQLQPATPAGHRLMAEAIWVLLLFQSNISAEKKRTDVRMVWSGSGSELDPGHPMLSDEVLVGLGNPGTSYNTRRWRELSFLITLVRMFKQLDPAQRRNLLSDGWLLATWLRDVPEADKRQFRHVLLHLLFPDTFERISSSNDKRRIVAAFTHTSEREVDGWDSERIDREILRIRERVERERGKEIDFYVNGLKEQWKPSAPAWLLSWNPRYWPWTSLAEDRASTARGQSVIHDWRCSSSKPKEGDHAYLVRVGEAPKGVIAYGTVVKAPYEAPHYDPDDAQAGKMARFINVEFSAVRDATRDPIVPLDDLQDRQLGQTWNPQGSGILISPKAVRVLEDLWSVLPPVEVDDDQAVLDVSRPVAVSLEPPRNLILFGPPGTGKTYRLLSSYLPAYRDADAEAPRRYEFVTFHQSYAYEDFVEGIRPTIQNGTVGYEVKPGVFRRLCERAKKDQARRHAIFIDEINRGNIAKIFGELITLLEPDKRAAYDAQGTCLSGLEVTLPYSGERFGVPANLDVFGTMNTADRSIALLDVALRRRFEFEEVAPTPGAVTGLDGEGTIPDDDGGEIDLRRLLSTLNRRITHLLHRDQTIGHAYLVKVKDFVHLRRVLAREIVPLLQEYFYDDWRRICLVLGDHPRMAAEHRLVRQVLVDTGKLFPGAEDEVADAQHYEVTGADDITPEAVRAIYEGQA